MKLLFPLFILIIGVVFLFIGSIERGKVALENTHFIPTSMKVNQQFITNISSLTCNLTLSFTNQHNKQYICEQLSTPNCLTINSTPGFYDKRTLDKPLSTCYLIDPRTNIYESNVYQTRGIVISITGGIIAVLIDIYDQKLKKK